MSRASVLSLALLSLSACTPPLVGAATGIRFRGQPYEPVATVSANKEDGVRVLMWSPYGKRSDGRAWLAADPAQYAILWDALGNNRPAPRVDFRTHVVLADEYDGSGCQPEIEGASVDARGVFRFEERPLVEACSDALVHMNKIVSVPRSVLPAHFTWWTRVRGRSAFEFDLPPASNVAPGPENPVAPMEVAAVNNARGSVGLPELGHISLRQLDDGSEVWVAHHTDGRVSVLATDRAIPGREARPALVQWEQSVGRFDGGYDLFGQSVHGMRTLEGFQYARMNNGRIAIGDRVRLPLLPFPTARNEAPMLDGEAVPYADVPVLTLEEFGQRPAGTMARVDADVVWGLHGPARLCKPPADRKLQNYWTGCDDTALLLTTASAQDRAAVTRWHGPVLVRRGTQGVDLAFRGPNGESGRVSENHLTTPAAQGSSSQRGALGLDTAARGNTSSSRDGFHPPCVVAPGSPDDAWDFTAPTAGRFGFELTTLHHDGAIAVVGDDGAVLACNDDRHGDYSSSLAHVALAAGKHVRVIVDGFGGNAGEYTLRAVSEPALENDGVIAAGAAVHGNTALSTDDVSAGCYTPGPDDTWKLVVPSDGNYRVKLDASGWAATLAIRADLASNPLLCGYHVGEQPGGVPLATGTWFVTVDSANENQGGAYTLSVERVGP